MNAISSSDRIANLAAFARDLKRPLSTLSLRGRIGGISTSGWTVEGLSGVVRLGDLVAVSSRDQQTMAEVIRIDPKTILAKPLTASRDIALFAEVTALGPLRVSPDPSWKGRVISALARPIDGAGPLAAGHADVSVQAQPPKALGRSLVQDRVKTGVTVIDTFTPLCFGQRIGVFSGSGVGKSTMLSMMAQTKSFDTAVIALIGERGREVNEFIEETLGAARQKAIVVVSTGDESAMLRKLAALLATTIAEYFRDSGERVLLMMDSVTRYAQACREVALAAGEPAVSRGFPPSVFAALPELLERAGPGEVAGGSITGVYSVLVDGDNHNEPVADAIRGTLDGHIVLDRAIAASGRYPAVDVLGSLSRLFNKALTSVEQKTVIELRSMIARFEDSRDLRALGGYTPGQDPELDKVLERVPKLYQALNQKPADGPRHLPISALAAAAGITLASPAQA